MATTETMTVHKALAELKVLDKRIQDAMLSTYVGTKKNNQDKVLGYTPDQFNEHVKNQFTKVCDLIRRRNALKDAVNVSNANTVVTIGGKEYTVVQAIDKKNHGMEYYIQLHNLLASELADAKKEMETKNASLQQKAEAFVTNLMGNKDTKVNSDEYDKAVKTYITSNTVDIIDPLGIEKKIAELEEMINSFMPEVDSALSVSNALTTITISY
jgi:hypothetical protein